MELKPIPAVALLTVLGGVVVALFAIPSATWPLVVLGVLGVTTFLAAVLLRLDRAAPSAVSLLLLFGGALIGTRALVALLSRGYGLLPDRYLNDALGFEQDALLTAQAWKTGGLLPSYLIERGDFDDILYRQILALFAFDPEVSVGLVWSVNILIAVAALSLLLALAQRTGPWGRAAGAGLLLLLVPSVVAFTSMPIRDNLLLLLNAVVIVAIAWPGLRPWIRMAGVGVAIYLMASVRLHYAGILGLALGLTGAFYLFRWARTQGRRTTAAVVLGLVLVGITGIFLAVRVAFSILPIAALSPGGFNLFRMAVVGSLPESAGSGYLTEVSIGSWPEVFFFTGLAAVMFMYGPILGIGAGAAGLLAALEGLIWLLLTVSLIRRLRREGYRPLDVVALSLILVGLPLFGLGTADYGTATRMRLQFMPFLLLSWAGEAKPAKTNAADHLRVPGRA